MEALVGFELDVWDYLTFLTLLLCVEAVTPKAFQIRRQA
jgi:hypothetical protein